MEEESEEWQLELWFLLVDDTEAGKKEGKTVNCYQMSTNRNIKASVQDGDDLLFLFFFYCKHIYF